MLRVAAFSQCTFTNIYFYLPSSKCKMETRLKFTRSRWAAVDFPRRLAEHTGGGLWVLARRFGAGMGSGHPALEFAPLRLA